MLASYDPANTTWYLPIGDGDTLLVEWVHVNCSTNAVPVFAYDAVTWNEPCDVGYDARTAQSAFQQLYAAQGISTGTIEYMYYPHIVASVSGNWTKLILAENVSTNRTLALVPTCAYHFIGGLNNVLVSAIDDADDDLYTYYYQSISPLDVTYLTAIVNPFAGESCFYDGEICWSLMCETSQSLSDAFKHM